MQAINCFVFDNNINYRLLTSHLVALNRLNTNKY